jgi:DNA-binding MarR family transcriptional regulator
MSLLFDVWLVNQATTRLVDDALAPTGITGDEFALYSLLRGYGPTTATQIGRWTGMRTTTLSVALKRLHGRGHTTQAPNPADGRSRLIGLTAAGTRAHARAGALFLESMDALGAELPGDHAEERRMLRRIDAALRAVLGLDDRPYDLEAGGDAATPARWAVSYDGAALSEREEADVRRYIDFVRTTRRNDP